MKKEDIKLKSEVKDRWYPEKGTGVITKITKTRITVLFSDGEETLDFIHAKTFLELI